MPSDKANESMPSEVTEPRQISWYSIFIDQVETGLEESYLPAKTISEARRRYNLGNKTIPFRAKQKLRLRIWETIHYQALVDPRLSAIFDQYMKISDQKEHSYAHFIELVDRISGGPVLQKIVLAECENGFRICDGVHRASILYWASGSLVARENFMFPYEFKRCVENFQVEVRKSLKKSRPLYKTPFRRWTNPSQFEAGYHSFEIGGVKLQGQRNPVERLKLIAKHLELTGASIVDFGCNTGGMLFHQEKIGRGIGLDIDPRSVKSAERVRRALSSLDREFSSRFEFFVVDLDRCDLNLIGQLLRSERIDLAFVLSLGSWLKNWKRLYGYLISIGIPFVLETNNEHEGEEQLSFIRGQRCEVIMISSKSNDDKSGNHGRAMYYVLSPHSTTWLFCRQQISKR